MYNNTFDVIVADKLKCGARGRCRLTYSKSGDLLKVGPPFPIDIVAERVGAVKAFSQEEGFFAVGYCNTLRKTVCARFISNSGVMKRFNTDLTTGISLSNIPISTNHGLYTLCGLYYVSNRNYDNSIVNCRQFDLKSAASRLNMTFEYPRHMKAISIHNIPRGGFLVAALGCGKEYQEENCNLFVDRIYAGGKKLGLYSTQLQTSCGGDQNEIMLDIEYEGESEFCFYVACTSKPFPDWNRLLSFSRECLSLSL
ncbi:hypothetical protein QAD02_000874 [Eretmocerus hayati]|uniref:Uncharacterized protein n=1 Tax=Eretmocerus hayati TaxID=131215 RepID=A0ACC2NJ76_9HYME|nr:hypothetical protein QAD02_000874 [Eretmocerus hayati]